MSAKNNAQQEREKPVLTETSKPPQLIQRIMYGVNNDYRQAEGISDTMKLFQLPGLSRMGSRG